MHPRPFPPEIWSQAIQWLPMSDKKTLLEVSRFFHDTVLPFIFSSVKIYVLDGYAATSILEIPNQSSIHEIEEKLMRRSREILLQILVDANFARLIKDMTLVVFTDDILATFEKLTLVKALGALHNLRTLRCYGEDSAENAFGEILQTISGTVEHLLCPTFIPTDFTKCLPNIEFFEYCNLTYTPGIGAPPSLPLKNLGFDVLTHTKLKSLAIDTLWVTHMPVWLYNRLVFLEICNFHPANPISLDFICYHCSVLEELSFNGMFSASLCLGLPRETTFPRLRSFRLTCNDFMFIMAIADEYSMALARFVQAHNNLRRVHLHLPIVECSHLQPLLGTIANLRCLEVLGLGIDGLAFTETELEHVLYQVPVNLKALQLSMSCDRLTSNHAHILMNALSKMPNLSFLRIYEISGHLPLSPADLAIHLTGLTRVGLTRSLWDIDQRDPTILSEWPLWKTIFFAESNFDDPDDAWLFKFF